MEIKQLITEWWMGQIGEGSRRPEHGQHGPAFVALSRSEKEAFGRIFFFFFYHLRVKVIFKLQWFSTKYWTSRHKTFVFCVCIIFMYVWVQICVCMLRSEDNIWEFILSYGIWESKSGCQAYTTNTQILLLPESGPVCLFV